MPAHRVHHVVLALTIIVPLVFTVSSTAFGEGDKDQQLNRADELLEQCELVLSANRSQDDLVSALQCASYIHGFRDASDEESLRGHLSTHFCIPASTNNAQLVRVFVTFAQAHPEVLGKTQATVLGWSLHDAFPCSKAK